MYLVDTCGWIEWLVDSKLKADFATYLSEIDQLIVPTIVQMELYKWVCRERDEALALDIIGITDQANVISLDTNLALYAADIAKEHKLAMADSIIYACARMKKVELVTSDAHFKELPEVIYFSK